MGYVWVCIASFPFVAIKIHSKLFATKNLKFSEIQWNYGNHYSYQRHGHIFLTRNDRIRLRSKTNGMYIVRIHFGCITPVLFFKRNVSLDFVSFIYLAVYWFDAALLLLLLLFYSFNFDTVFNETSGSVRKISISSCWMDFDYISQLYQSSRTPCVMYITYITYLRNI